MNNGRAVLYSLKIEINHLTLKGQEAVKISIRARQIDDVRTCNSPCQQHGASGG
jgi:hypothetical protein